jgi:hypothetical protein
VHVEALLGDRLEARPARGIPNGAFKLRTLRLQRVSPLAELSNFGLLAYAERSPRYDACGHQNETNQ